MDAKKKAKLIRTLTDALYELFATDVGSVQTAATKEPKAQTKGRRGKKPVLKAVETKPVKKTRGPKKGVKAPQKPCPVTGVLNTHRRFSYLMPEVRTPENLAKFKGGGKAKAAA